MEIMHYKDSERVQVSAATAASTTPSDNARVVRVVSTSSIFFAKNATADIVNFPYLPYNAAIYISLAPGDVLSFIAEPSTTGDQYVYVTSVSRVLG